MIRQALFGVVIGGAAVALPFIVTGQDADSSTRLLSRDKSPQLIQQKLGSLENWTPYPRVADRASWEAFPYKLRRDYIRRGEQLLSFEWPALPASTFLGYTRRGDRATYDRRLEGRRKKLRDLVLAEAFEGKGRFLDPIVNGIWAICEETYWDSPAHLPRDQAGTGLPDVARPNVALIVAETAALLAWTLYLLEPELEKISPQIPRRIRYEVQRRFMAPSLEKDLHWMGFEGQRVNNHNSWMNANWITSLLILEEDPKIRAQAIYKSLRSLDVFFDQYPPDGGCDEGPSYWDRAAGSLFEALELLHSASGGTIRTLDHPKFQELARYIMRVHIHDDYVANFADASGRGFFPGYLVYLIGERLDDPKMKAFGAWRARREGFGERALRLSLGRELSALFGSMSLLKQASAQPYIRDVWLPDTQIMAARSVSGSAEGLYLAAKGGHNGEHHNHNDVGNFIVYMDGLPGLIDLGAPTYSRMCSSSDRYKVWTMQSAYHNLPTVNGQMQSPGPDFGATNVEYHADEDRVMFSLDIAPAYPAQANLSRWIRSVELRRRSSVEITERFTFKTAPKSIEINLMTPYPARVVAGGIQVEGDVFGRKDKVRFRILFDDGALDSRVETIPITDPRLQQIWGDKMRRILIRTRSLPKEGRITYSIQNG